MPQQQSQPQTGQQQAQHHAVQALQQHAAAHGLNINWGAVLPILIQLVQVLSQGGGAQPQAQAGQPKTP